MLFDLNKDKNLKINMQKNKTLSNYFSPSHKQTFLSTSNQYTHSKNFRTLG